jgi:hypothetical protein
MKYTKEQVKKLKDKKMNEYIKYDIPPKPFIIKEVFYIYESKMNK